jgi:osmotically-inducible protein OsmY
MSPIQPKPNYEDERLASAVREALDQDTALRMWKNSIEVRAAAGTIVLSGNLRSQTEKETAETRARGVKGVLGVDNQLVIDADLEREIALALSADARTRAGFPGILVGVVLGVGFLKGTVASEDIRKAAGEIAGKVAGVLRLSNELRLIPAKVTA